MTGTEERAPRWRRGVPVLPVVAALVAGVAVYVPALRSGFVTDDYVYLYSVKSLSFWHYLRVSLVPNAHDSTLVLPQQFWRPLYFVSFQPMERLFGGHAVLYHLVNLCIHLVTIVLVWLLAEKLTGSWQASGVAAAIFAVHPAGVASIAWVSSVNSVALPLGLAAWLLFVIAVERAPAEPVRWRLIAWSILLVALGLLMRETALVAVAGLGLWYVFVPARGRLREPRTYLALAPYVAVVLVFGLLRTSFLTVSPEGSAPIRFGSQIPGQIWYYWKLALFPVHGSAAWASALRTAGAFVVLGVLAGAVLLRRWLVVALLFAFLVSVVPYATLSLDVSERYFYFPAALFALACG
ncbi:MAG TPA: glycosyltransferase family 39 protein, partial [Tepidiformaceae bacterium]|nr:glycosyltransferase family 39 protein [Tepidiformaceae bacterium]